MIASISAKKSLYFWIIIKQLSYHSIGLRSNIIYYLFNVKWSYEDLIRNISNAFLSFCDKMHCFDCQSINIRLKFYSSYIRFIYTSTIKPLFNISTISSFKWYIRHTVINLWSQSKGKSSKSSFWWLLTYIQLLNDNLIELIFNLSAILSVKPSIGIFVNNIFSYSKVT